MAPSLLSLTGLIDIAAVGNSSELPAAFRCRPDSARRELDDVSLGVGWRLVRAIVSVPRAAIMTG